MFRTIRSSTLPSGRYFQSSQEVNLPSLNPIWVTPKTKNNDLTDIWRKKKVQLFLFSLHPASQIHQQRWGPFGAEGSPPYPLHAEVPSFYCPSYSQFCCLQTQTPPWLSLSLSLCSLHALHHPSSLHRSWNTAGGWSFVGVTNRLCYRPCTPPYLTVFYQPSLSVTGLDEQKGSNQARSQSVWNVAALQAKHWTDSESHSLSWVCVCVRVFAARFPWQPPCDSSFTGTTAVRLWIQSLCTLETSIHFLPAAFLKSTKQPAHPLTYTPVNISTARSSAGHNNRAAWDKADKF